ncbi:MAG: hypothetical protein Q8N90_01220 [bacterium]|nr:hypothetical protein [bacterium]
MEKFPEKKIELELKEKKEAELTPERIEDIEQEIEGERDQMYEDFCDAQFLEEEDTKWADVMNEAGVAIDRQAALVHLKEYHEYLRKTYPKSEVEK